MRSHADGDVCEKANTAEHLSHFWLARVLSTADEIMTRRIEVKLYGLLCYKITDGTTISGRKTIDRHIIEGAGTTGRVDRYTVVGRTEQEALERLYTRSLAEMKRLLDASKRWEKHAHDIARLCVIEGAGI